MKCDVNRGVCESTKGCILQPRGTFRKSDKSADKCGKRNIFFVSNKHRMFYNRITLHFITFLCFEFSNYFKVPHPPPESPKKCCELFGVPEMCQSLCRSGQSAGYNNEYTIPSCRPYELEIAKCKGKILYDSF